jgi:hypothetical protein
MEMHINASFDLWNRLLKWNGYSYGIVILLFGKGLFFENRYSNGNTYSLGVKAIFSRKNHLFFFFIF